MGPDRDVRRQDGAGPLQFLQPVSDDGEERLSTDSQRSNPLWLHREEGLIMALPGIRRDTPSAAPTVAEEKSLQAKHRVLDIHARPRGLQAARERKTTGKEEERGRDPTERLSPSPRFPERKDYVIDKY